MRPAPNEIEIERQTCMYGYIRGLNVYRNNENIGGAHLSHGFPEGSLWTVCACGYEAELFWDESRTAEENIQAVETLLRLQVSAADALKNARAA